MKLEPGQKDQKNKLNTDALYSRCKHRGIIIKIKICRVLSREFEPRSVLIIIFCGLKGIEKREEGLQVICTALAGISLHIQAFSFSNGCI